MRAFWIVLGLMLIPRAVFGAGFSITPMLQEVSLDGNSGAESSVAIRNETTVSATFEISTIDFKGLDQSGGIAFLGASDIANTYSLAPWLVPEMSQVTLSPLETREIRVKLNNDETLSPGGHYGALVFRQVSLSGPVDVPKVALQQLFTSLFFVKKISGAKYGMELESWGAKRHMFQPFSAQKVTFRATGNVHIVPRGEISVSDPFGRLIAKASLNESSAIVLPGMIREFPIVLHSVLIAWIPGKYRLTLQYRSDDISVPQISERDEIFIPFRFLLSLAVFPLLFFTFRLFFRFRTARSASPSKSL